MTAAITLSQVSKEYAAGVRALDDVSLTVERGSFLAVMGPSGSGKSTLMHCAAGLDSPTSGSIRIDGQEIGGLNETRRTELRRERVGFVFQAYNLIPSLSIEDNITLPLRLAGRTPDHDWLRTLVQRVGLADRLTHCPAELSGGQQQRAAVVRALVARPAVVFADEPTGALDLRSAHEVLDLLRDLDDAAASQNLVSRAHAHTRARFTRHQLGGADRPGQPPAPANSTRSPGSIRLRPPRIEAYPRADRTRGTRPSRPTR
jgi:putative ABC transport system ATP-binding protein